jgi:hypothetical protein
VLAARRSAKMAHKRKHQRSIPPALAQLDRALRA